MKPISHTIILGACLLLGCRPDVDEQAVRDARALIADPTAFERAVHDSRGAVARRIRELMTAEPAAGQREMRALAFHFAERAGIEIRKGLVADSLSLIGEETLPPPKQYAYRELEAAGTVIGLAMDGLKDARRRGAFDGKPEAFAEQTLHDACAALDDALDPDGKARQVPEYMNSRVPFDLLGSRARNAMIDGIHMGGGHL